MSMKIFHFSRPPTPFVHLRPKFFHPFDLERPISNDSPLQMITNQLKEKIIQGWLLYVIRSFLQVGFRFQYQPINLVWLSFDFFSFSWSLVFFRGFILSCVQLSKIIYNYSYFWYSFSNQSVLLAQLENVNKLWNNNRTVHVNEQNRNKNKTTSRHIQIDHAFYCSI